MLNALNLHTLVDKFFELSNISAGSCKLEAVTMIVVIDLSKAHAQRVLLFLLLLLNLLLLSS